MTLNASFADFKIVKTRGVAQLVFEVDLAQADAALALLGGVPRPEQERWVSIAPVKADGARVNTTPGPEQPPALAKAGQPAPSEPTKAEAVARAIHDAVGLPRARPTDGERIRTRAVMLCKDENFQEWAAQILNSNQNEDVAIFLVRSTCGIRSRAELATDPIAQQKFLDLEAQYRAETGQMAERIG
jgi:hypothetical protein